MEEAPPWEEPAPWPISLPGLSVEVMPSQAVLLGRWTRNDHPDMPVFDFWPRMFSWLFECAEDNDAVQSWLDRRAGRHLVVAIMDISIFGRLTLRRHLMRTAVGGSSLRFHIAGTRQLFDRCWHLTPQGQWSPVWPEAEFHSIPAPPTAASVVTTATEAAEAAEAGGSERLAKRSRLSATGGSS